MKTQLIWITTLLCAVCMSSRSHAEEPENKVGKHHKLFELLNAFSGDERAKLHDARKQAKQNAEVAAADARRKKADAEYREILQREMLRIDPSLKPLLEKESELRQRVDF